MESRQLLKQARGTSKLVNVVFTAVISWIDLRGTEITGHWSDSLSHFSWAVKVDELLKQTLKKTNNDLCDLMSELTDV